MSAEIANTTFINKGDSRNTISLNGNEVVVGVGVKFVKVEINF